MENLRDIQQRITQKREAWEKAESAYYNALQEWSLAKQGITTGSGITHTTEDIELKLKEKNDRLHSLQEEINFLNKEALPQQVIEQVPGDFPFLMMPVRLEARYITTRFVIRNLAPDDAVDMIGNPVMARILQSQGFEPDEEGTTTYQVWSYHLLAASNLIPAMSRLNPADLKPVSGKYIKRRNDKHELRLRIYPDELFLNGHEQYLQPGEWEAGTRFWKNVCAGNDPRAEWMQLSMSVTPARTAWIIRSTQPENFSDAQNLPADPIFPTIKTLKDGAYTKPPVTQLLPERFIVRLYKNNSVKEFTGKSIPEPIILGLDPTHDPFNKDAGSGMKAEGSAISTPEYLEWIHNFAAAEKKGLAISIDLGENPEFMDGVDKIIVIGAKLSIDEKEGSRLLSRQLENYIYNGDGAAILPKGTPTNNFGRDKQEFNKREHDADLYFRSGWKKETASFQTDESRLFRAFGIGDGLQLPQGHSMDISEAEIMNKMLWPATWGYYLLQFFTPQSDEHTREQLRNFFTRYVSGRGTLPVLRINNQPYGILPVTSFRHWQYGEQSVSDEEKFASQVWSQYLTKLNAFWQILAGQIKTVSMVGGSGLDEQFFELLKTNHSSSIVYRQWMAGVKFQEMLMTAQRDPAAPLPLTNDPLFKPAEVSRLLNAMGFPHDNFTAVSGTYHATREQIQRPFVDEFSPSEERFLAPMAGKSWNYLQWLGNARLKNIWENNFSDAPSGDESEIQNKISIFSILTRQAVLRSFIESGMSIAEPNPGLWLLKVKDFETQHLHTAKIVVHLFDRMAPNKLFNAYKPIIDKFQLTTPFELEPDRRLYFERAYTQTGAQTLADWLDENKKTDSLPNLKEVMQAVEYFSSVPTARLERLFAEHLDLCSYRLDAWMEGLISQRLNKQRKVNPTGIYIGSFGYLLNLKPNKPVHVVFDEVEPEYVPAEPNNVEIAAIPLINALAASQRKINPSGEGWVRSFFYIGDNISPRVRLNTRTRHVEPDELINLVKSDGFIHAPSTAHATTAAILRSGFLNHPADEQTALLAIQLNSRRVRQALQMLEGMQKGISIEEFLGYFFERLLHENKADGAVFNLRMAFPLKRTDNGGESPSLMTTTNGLNLLKSWRHDPIAWLSAVPGLNPADHGKINKAAQMLEDHLDSLGDLLLAESVYQTAKGNRDRAAAALRIMNSGGQVLLPEFVRTPMKGRAITHRVGAIFHQQKIDSPWEGWATQGTPRAILSPGLNNWLRTQLPDPARIQILIRFPGERNEKISLADITIEPLDLLYLLPETFTNANESMLAFYIQVAIQKKLSIDFPMEQNQIQVDLKDRSLFDETEMSILEIGSLLSVLKKIITTVRPISPNDFLLPDEPAAANDNTDASALKKELTGYVAADGAVTAIVQALRIQARDINTLLEKGTPVSTLKTSIHSLAIIMVSAWQSAMLTSGSEGILTLDMESINRLVIKAEAVASELEDILVRARESIKVIQDSATGDNLFKQLQEVVSIIFGKSLPVFPNIIFQNDKEVKEVYEGRQWIENTDTSYIDEWMRESALVRKELVVYRRSVLLSDIVSNKLVSRPLIVLQFPFFNNQKQAWIGGKMPVEPTDNGAEESTQKASLSLLLETPVNFDITNSFTGFIIDEWPEWIPDRTVDTGVAFQYNQPNSEPPQSMLLAVNPVEGVNWKWEHLAGAVEEALEMAKKRLVTPEQLNVNAGLRQTLPAVVLPFMPNNNHTAIAEKL